MIDKIKYKCIVCEKTINNHGKCKSNSGILGFGYGSALDMTTIEICVCDDCMKEKIKKKVITKDHFLNIGEEDFNF